MFIIVRAKPKFNTTLLLRYFIFRSFSYYYVILYTILLLLLLPKFVITFYYLPPKFMMNLGGNRHKNQDLNDTDFDFSPIYYRYDTTQQTDTATYPSESNQIQQQQLTTSETANNFFSPSAKNHVIVNKNNDDDDYDVESNEPLVAEQTIGHALLSSSSADQHLEQAKHQHHYSHLLPSASLTTTSSSAAATTLTATASLIRDSIEHHNNHQKPDENFGYQLRALKEDISTWKTNPWTQPQTIPHNINVSSLSNELVNETLNYFVNCGQRLSQMTKTYDDNDAYILLLQEKEVDLELAARIGQDLLKQNKQLKDSIKSLEDELVKRQDDVQQLKHELASKTSLLDTFIEEEEHQTSLAENEEESLTTIRQQEHSISNKSNHDQAKHLMPTTSFTPDVNNIDDHDDDNDNEAGPSGFLSLNFTNQKPANFNIEPFSSLPYTLLTNSRQGESTSWQQAYRDDSSSTLNDDLTTDKQNEEQQKLVQTVTFQLVESNKRLCELQDELLYKSEQNLIQQEKIYNLQEQLRETDRRLGDISTENESLKKSLSDSMESQKELNDELKNCKRNFSDLLNVFLELQKESRVFRNRDMQQDSNYFDVIDPINDMHNISFDLYNNYTPIPNQNNATIEHPSAKRAAAVAAATTKPNLTSNKTNARSNSNYNGHNKNLPMSSSSLLEELQECMQKDGEKHNVYVDDSSDGDATDGGDSGVHTHNRKGSGGGSSQLKKSTSSSSGYVSGLLTSCGNTSLSVTPSANGLMTDNDDEEEEDNCQDHNQEQEVDGDDEAPLVDLGNKKNWLGFSSFMLTTLLLLCLSVTISSSSNLNLAHKLQSKLDR